MPVGASHRIYGLVEHEGPSLAGERGDRDNKEVSLCLFNGLQWFLAVNPNS